MVIEDQSEVIAFLSSPSTHGGENVERVETHTAIVFLVGSHAYKLKRAVRFDYVDFSTLARRRAYCEAEVRLNRRTAPALYRGVVAVVRTAAGALALAQDGNALEWLVEMNRFDQSQLLIRWRRLVSSTLKPLRTSGSPSPHSTRLPTGGTTTAA